MDVVRDIVAEVEDALGEHATADQVETIAAMVLERLRLPQTGDPSAALLQRPEYAVVTASGQNSPTILPQISNLLADSGAVIEEVSQTVRGGVLALTIQTNISRVAISLLELKKRLQSAAAAQNVRVSIHRSDLYAAITAL